MAKIRVTIRQMAVIKFIRETQKRDRRSPSLTEIGEFLGASSANQAARGHLLLIEKKGIIRRKKGAHHFIQFLKKMSQIEIGQWNGRKKGSR